MGITTVVLVGCLALVALSVWLPVALARRWFAAPWRPFAASLGAALGLALTGWLAVLSLTSLAAS